MGGACHPDPPPLTGAMQAINSKVPKSLSIHCKFVHHRWPSKTLQEIISQPPHPPTDHQQPQ